MTKRIVTLLIALAIVFSVAGTSTANTLNQAYTNFFSIENAVKTAYEEGNTQIGVAVFNYINNLDKRSVAYLNSVAQEYVGKSLSGQLVVTITEKVYYKK